MDQPQVVSSQGIQDHNQYLPGYKATHIKHHSWRTAENSAAYLLPTLQHMAKEKPDLRLLDCGAGPGTISASLARYIPHGTVTATDLSAEVVERAAAHAAEQGVSNMRFETASIYDLPYEDDSFDVVHAQQVLCHLDSPLQALQSMLRVCRPGGIVAIREVDMRMWSFYPELPGLAAFHKLIMQCMSAAGGSNALGPRLVSLAMKAGVRKKNIEASMGAWCYSTREEREAWGGTMAERVGNGEMRKKALELGLATAEEMEDMAKAWDEWVATDEGCFGCLHGEVLITKT